MNSEKVVIGQSLIPGAGKGLFAIENIMQGEVIVHVTGTRYSASDVEELHYENNYLLEVNDESGDCIEVTGPARYANDANGISAMPGVVNNAEFCSAEDHSMYLEATLDILKGEEILVDYGAAYWQELKEELALAAS